MMTAVLLDSVKVGSTSWFATKRGNGLEVRGMEDGDQLLAVFETGDRLSVDEDGTFPLPSNVERVRVEHVQIAQGKSRGVCVDLVRKKSWAF